MSKSVHDIISNWVQSTDEECVQVKNEIWSIIPEWTNEKVGCVQALNNQYVFFKDYYSYQNNEKVGPQCVIYDVETNKFSASEKCWRQHLPDGYKTIRTFTSTALFGNRMSIVFFKYTGIYGVQIIKANIDSGSSSSLLLWFENGSVIEECIDYCTNSTNPVIMNEPNELGDKETHYTFDSSKLMDRYTKWYHGEWVKMDRDGINSDSAYSEKMALGTVIHERAFRTIDKDKFIKNFQNFREADFTCDVCRTEGIYSDFVHCLDCIKYTIKGEESKYCYAVEQAYNECENCHKTSTHPHTMLSASDNLVIEKYKTQILEIKEWNALRNEEYTKNEKLRVEYREQKLTNLNKLLLEKNKSQTEIDEVIAFCEQKQNHNHIVVTDPAVVFAIAAVHNHLMVFTSYDLFDKWFQNHNAYENQLIYLNRLSVEESTNAINISKAKYSATKIITNTDYVEPAIKFICAIKTWDNNELDISLIDFVHTGVRAMAIEICSNADFEYCCDPETCVEQHAHLIEQHPEIIKNKENPINENQTIVLDKQNEISEIKQKEKQYHYSQIFWFENDEIAHECRKYLLSKIRFNFNGNDIGREKLTNLIQSSDYSEVSNEYVVAWFDGHDTNPDIIAEFRSSLDFITFDKFKNEFEFIESNKVEEHFTLNY